MELKLPKIISEKKYNRKLKHFINEAYGCFDRQNEFAYTIAKEVYQLYFEGYSEGTIKCDWCEDVKSAYVRIKKNLLNVSSASINAIDPETKKVTIYVLLGNYITSEKATKQDFIHEITSVISHELMHGNIFFKRNEKKLDIEDTPEEYEKIVTVMRNADGDSLLYMFARALYSTYYQEENALISQVPSEIHKLSKGKINRNNVFKIMKETDPYITFFNSYSVLCPYLNKLSDKDLIFQLVEPLSEFDINVDVQWIRKKIKFIYHHSKHALDKILRVSMMCLIEPKFLFRL